MKKLQNHLDEIDILIKNGKFKESKNLFKYIVQRVKFERRDAVIVASYARRLHLPREILKILRPYVRPRIHRYKMANEGEKAEYAAGLIQLGQINEALNLLKEIEYPENYLKCFQIEASAHMSTWNYESAEATLRKLIKVGQGKISNFDHMIAEVNLAECLLFQRRFFEAREKLTKIIADIDTIRYKLTLSKCFELKAECELHEGNFKNAMNDISRSLELSHDLESIETYYKYKTKIIVDFYLGKYNKKNEVTLSDLIDKTIDFQSFESLRELFFHYSEFIKSEKLKYRIFQGTRFEGFKKFYGKIENFEKGNERKRQVFSSYPFFKTSENQKIFFKDSRMIEVDLTKFAPGHMVTRILKILSSDFFNPPTLLGIHNELYGEKNYFHTSSENKVNQILFRTRSFIDKNKLPFILQEWKGRFFLLADKRYDVVNIIFPSNDPIVDKIMSCFLGNDEDHSLAIKDIFSCFSDISLRTLNSKLKQLVNEGKLMIMGRYKYTRYFKPKVTQNIVHNNDNFV